MERRKEEEKEKGTKAKVRAGLDLCSRAPAKEA